MAGGSSAGSGMNSPSAALSCHSWLPLFLSNDMVCAIFQLHQRMRSVILELHFPSKAIVISTNSGISIHVMQQTLSSCLGSISQMIISFASVDAGIAFPTREQKLSNGEILLAGTLVYLESNVFSSVFQSNQMEEVVCEYFCWRRMTQLYFFSLARCIDCWSSLQGVDPRVPSPVQNAR